MSSLPTPLPVPTPDQRRTAAEHFQYANHWLVVGKPEKALPFLRHCCQLDPGNLIYRQGLHSARRQVRPATGVFASLRRWSTSRQLQTATQAQDWTGVLRVAEDLLDLDVINAKAYLALARAFEEVGLLEHAVWCIEQVGNADPKVAIELRRLYERVGRFSQAQTSAIVSLAPVAQVEVKALREQLETAPADAQLYLQLVRLVRDAGDLNAARDWLDRGLSATKNNFDLLLERANLDLAVLRQDVAIAAEKLATDPDNRDLQEVRPRLQHELQSRELDLCRQGSERNLSDPEKRLELGILLLKAGQFDAALEEFQAVRREPRLAWRALVYSGYCHLNWGSSKRAAAFFEEALPLIPPEAEATRADVFSKLTEWRQGRTAS